MIDTMLISLHSLHTDGSNSRMMCTSYFPAFRSTRFSIKKTSRANGSIHSIDKRQVCKTTLVFASVVLRPASAISLLKRSERDAFRESISESHRHQPMSEPEFTTVRFPPGTMMKDFALAEGGTPSPFSPS